MSGVYWVLTCGGFQGSHQYETEAEAIMAAIERSRISGRLWVPRKIYY